MALRRHVTSFAMPRCIGKLFAFTGIALIAMAPGCAAHSQSVSLDGPGTPMPASIRVALWDVPPIDTLDARVRSEIAAVVGQFEVVIFPSVSDAQLGTRLEGTFGTRWNVYPGPPEEWNSVAARQPDESTRAIAVYRSDLVELQPGGTATVADGWLVLRFESTWNAAALGVVVCRRSGLERPDAEQLSRAIASVPRAATVVVFAYDSAGCLDSWSTKNSLSRPVGYAGIDVLVRPERRVLDIGLGLRGIDGSRPVWVIVESE